MGRGVFTTREYIKGEYICEYKGVLMTASAGKEKDAKDELELNKHINNERMKDSAYDETKDKQVSHYWIFTNLSFIQILLSSKK